MECVKKREEWKGEGEGEEEIHQRMLSYLKCPNSSPVGCLRDSHRCSLLHPSAQRETAQYLSAEEKIPIECVSLLHWHTHTHTHTHSHTQMQRKEGGGGRFITTTPEVVTARITQWQPTGAEDGRNRKSCQKRKRRKTHHYQKCVSVSIVTRRQSQQPGAPGVIKQREKRAKRGWSHALQKGKKKCREKIHQRIQGKCW